MPYGGSFYRYSNWVPLFKSGGWVFKTTGLVLDGLRGGGGKHVNLTHDFQDVYPFNQCIGYALIHIPLSDLDLNPSGFGSVELKFDQIYELIWFSFLRINHLRSKITIQHGFSPCKSTYIDLSSHGGLEVPSRELFHDLVHNNNNNW